MRYRQAVGSKLTELIAALGLDPGEVHKRFVPNSFHVSAWYYGGVFMGWNTLQAADWACARVYAERGYGRHKPER